MTNESTKKSPVVPVSPVHPDEPTVSKPTDVTNDGPAGEETKPDPTRFGDWEKNGRCIDF